MKKDYLQLIYSEIKKKGERINMRNGSRKTKAGKIQDK